MQFANVSNHLFRFLYAMDSEADSKTASGSQTGLSDYGRHVRRDILKPQNEVEWSKRLAALFQAQGFVAMTEQHYPGQDNRPPTHRERLDLRLQIGKHWLSIEVKGAWSDYWGRKNTTYRSYLLHPLVPGLDKSKTHTVPNDLKKLMRLKAPHTSRIGMLLIGFESVTDPMIEDVRLLRKLSSLNVWKQASDTWLSPNVPGQRVRCWYWQRSTD